MTIAIILDSRTKKHSSSVASCENCAYRSRCVINKISIEELASLSGTLITRSTLKKGQYLYRRGEPFSGVYSLRFGAIKNELVFHDGVPQVTHFSIPGDLLGLDGMGNGKHQLDAVCLNAVEVCSIPMSDVGRMTKDYPEFMGNVGSLLGTLLNASYAHNYDLSNLNPLQRLADFLSNYSNRLSTVGLNRDDFVLPMPRPDLANYLGMAVETLSRSLTHLEQVGAIEVSTRKIKFISRKPVFELLNSDTMREKHESMKSKTHSYRPFSEKRKP